MKTGYLMLFQNHHRGLSDAEMVRNEMRITEKKVKDLGARFDRERGLTRAR